MNKIEMLLETDFNFLLIHYLLIRICDNICRLIELLLRVINHIINRSLLF